MLHICLSTDKNYETMTKMCMYDIITRKNKDTEITFYVLADRLDSDTTVSEFNGIPGIKVIVIPLDAEKLMPSVDTKKLFYSRYELTKALYLRLLIPVLPQFDGITRVLYVDSDMFARRDVTDVYNSYIDDKALGIVKDNFYIRFDCPEEVMSAQGSGFNTGLMVMDLPRLRKLDFTNMSLFVSTMNNYNDQTTISRVFRSDIYQLDPINQIPIHNLIQRIPHMGNIDNWNKFHNTKYRSLEEIVDRSYFWHFCESKGWQMHINILRNLYQYNLGRLIEYERTHIVSYMDPEEDKKITNYFKHAIGTDGSTNCVY